MAYEHGTGKQATIARAPLRLLVQTENESEAKLEGTAANAACLNKESCGKSK